jgi:hypothetical protein
VLTAVLKPCGSYEFFYKASWKSVYTPQEALGGFRKAVGSFRKPVCSSHAALEKQLNTATRGFREVRENSKPIY